MSGVQADVEDATDATSAVYVDHSPARISSFFAVGAGVVAVLTSGLVSLLALLFGAMGLGLLAASLFAMDSRAGTTVGTAGIFVCVLISGFLGNGAEMMLLSTIATILAWDFGQNAISVGRQLTRDSPTRRNEVVHIAQSTVVGVVIAGLGYGTFQVVAAAGGQRYAGAVAFLVFGTVLLIWAIRT